MTDTSTHTDSRPTLERVDLAGLFAGFTEHWAPRLVARVDDHEVKAAKLLGEFVWHHHETDEMFLVRSGTLVIRLPDGEVTLGPGQMYVVPRGVEHCPVAEEEVELLMFEAAGTVNTGSAGGSRTREPVPAFGQGRGSRAS
ncbi:cupin domain-containing protein [Streptomyces sp. BI20]|uniref:cupin domain-containing protein n=1 Tax=Streptomyces sp. BI20 TaxID=3403460 RepID=UPI003C786DCF